MILIPEIETIVILVPRTGTKSLRRAITNRFPRAIHLYRHMEADGVPAGYDRWQKVGVVRDPVDRLWSLHKYLANFEGKGEEAEFVASMRAQAEIPFETWLLTNRIPFTTPYSTPGDLRFYPFYTARHPLPENRKSQYLYLRPDLGTRYFRYADQLEDLWEELHLDEVPRLNDTTTEPPPPLSPAALLYVANVFGWDLDAAAVPRLRTTERNPDAVGMGEPA